MKGSEVNFRLGVAQAGLSTQGYKLHEPYQVDGVRWLLSREVETNSVQGGFLCDEMGLGKTIQLITLCLANPLQNTLLVVPASLIGQWIHELSKIAPQLNIFCHHGTNRIKESKDVTERTANPTIWITTYGLMRDDRVIKMTQWDRVILEEAHTIRNRKSRTSKAAYELNSPIKWIVTGTPIQNSIRDLVTLFGFIGVGSVYVNSEPDKCRERFVLRRTKDRVKEYSPKFQIPARNEHIIRLPFKSPEEEKFYNNIKNTLQKELMNSLYKFNTVHIIELILRLRQASIFPQLVIDGYSKKWKKKFPKWEYTNTKLEFIIGQINEKRDRCIVFTNFKGETDYLYRKLTGHNFRTEVIQGCVSLKERDGIIRRCQEIVDPEENGFVDILLIQINAGGTGLNLQKFNVVYFTSPNWNPSLEEQAIGRSHRIGQDREVQVYKTFLEAEEFETIEKYIFSKQEMKNKVIQDFIKD